MPRLNLEFPFLEPTDNCVNCNTVFTEAHPCCCDDELHNAHNCFYGCTTPHATELHVNGYCRQCCRNPHHPRIAREAD